MDANLEAELNKFIEISNIKGLDQKYDNMYKHKKDNFNYASITLPNHLKIVFIEDPTTTMSGAHMFVGTGVICDPPDTPGLSHFLEHLLFMGSKKYPDASLFMQMVNDAAGMTNAYTGERSTQYYFNTSSNYFMKVFDCFCQFFIDPLFMQEYVEKEITAVDSEHQKNIGNDTWRRVQLYKEFLENGTHDKFGTGYRETLMGTKSAEELRQKIVDYFTVHYSADNMILGVYHNKIDQKFFDQVCNLGKKIKLRDPSKTAITKKIMEIPGKFIPNPHSGFHTIWMKSIMEEKSLNLSWIIDCNLYYISNRHQDCVYMLDYILGHEGRGSLCDILKEKHWITDLSAGIDSNYGSNISFGISIDFTDEGYEKFVDVIAHVFSYLEHITDLYKDQTEFKKMYDEMENLRHIGFRNHNQGSGLDYLQNIVDRVAEYNLDIRYSMIPGAIKHDYDLIYKNFMKCIQMMKMDTAKLFIMTDKLKDPTSIKEDEHYQTKYYFSMTPFRLFKKIDILTHPRVNPYIVNWKDIDIALCRMPGQSKQKNKLSNSLPFSQVFKENYVRLPTKHQHNHIYYEKNNRYDDDKQYINLSIWHQNIGKNATLKIANTIYWSYMYYIMRHLLYTISNAQYNVNYYSTTKISMFMISGFCNMMEKIVKKVTTKYIKPVKYNPKIYEIIFDEIKKNLENSLLTDAYVQVNDLFFETADAENYVTIDEKLKIIDNFSPKNMEAKWDDFIDLCRSQNFKGNIRGVVGGAIRYEDAIQIIQFIESVFIPIKQPVPSELKIAKTNITRKNKNEFDLNNAILYSIYLGSRDFGSAEQYNSRKWANIDIISDLLAEFASEKFFSHMRTENETGYLASARCTSVDSIYKSHLYLTFCMQTELDYTMMIDQIKKFVKNNIVEELKEITDELFRQIIQSKKDKYKQLPKNIQAEMGLIDNIIFLRNYKDNERENFDYHDILIDQLEKLTKKDFISTSIQWILNNQDHHVVVYH